MNNNADISTPKGPLDFSADDAGNAEYCAMQLSSQYLNVSGDWLCYTGSHWMKAHAHDGLSLLVVECLRKREAAASQPQYAPIRTAARPSRTHINAAIEILRSHLRCNPSEFDSSLDELNCANGVIDLKTGKLQAHEPCQRFTYCIDIDYDPQAATQVWDNFLSQALNDQQELISFLQRAVGYSLTGHTREHKFFYLYGPTRAGKSTFTTLVARVLGDEPLAIPVGFDTFNPRNKSDSQNFDLAHLRHCRFVMASESDHYQQLDTPELLRITGGDRVRCAEKYKEPFIFTPQFKLWFASNAALQGQPTNDAFWARALVVDFPNSYLGREDKQLTMRLQQPQALKGILNWAVEGAKQWYKDGLRPPKSVINATEAARRQCGKQVPYGDPVSQWIDQQVVSSPDGFVTNEQIRASYEAFRTPKDLPQQTAAMLTKTLCLHGFNAGVQRKVNNKNQRGCEGIRLLAGNGNTSIKK